MSEFVDALVIYWNGFSTISQTLIGRLGATVTGHELSPNVTHWTFYGILLGMLIFLIRARQAKMRNRIETRQRINI